MFFVCPTHSSQDIVDDRTMALSYANLVCKDEQLPVKAEIGISIALYVGQIWQIFAKIHKLLKNLQQNAKFPQILTQLHATWRRGVVEGMHMVKDKISS